MTPISKSPWFQSIFLGLSVIALAMAGSLQAELAAYGVFKGENYFQEGPGAPGAAQLDEYGVKAFAVIAPDADPFLIFVQPEGDMPFPLVLQSLDEGSEWFGEGSFSTAAAREENFPDGLVTFQVMGFPNSAEATLTLATPALPPIPAVVNYTETQAIDPEQPFTLAWNSFAGAGAQDVVWVRIDSNEGVAFSTPLPGAAGALGGTATQVVIPAGTLSQQEYMTATIAFVKVGVQTAGSLPDSTSLAGSYRCTSLDLALVDEGGNGGPTDGPVLVSTTPSSGSINVSPDTEVRFQFSRPMAPIVDIIWTAGGNELPAHAFSYSWSGDGSTLVATYPPTFPPNAFVTWGLGDSFEDATGVPLAGEENFGFFMTGAGNDDCDENDPLEQAGNFGFTRALMFEQTGPGIVVPMPEESAFFGAIFNPPVDFSVTGASFTPPMGESRVMHRFFGTTYFVVDAFNTESELNEVYPLGDYVARVEPAVGSAITMTVTVSGASVPTPEVINYTAGQAIDPAAPFTLLWNSFTGADAASFIHLDIMDREGDTVFSAPNECLGIELEPTATSIIVPAGILQPGRTYELTLSFFRITDSREHPASEITFLAAQGAITETTLSTIGGGVVEDYRLSEARIGVGGTFQATVTGTAGTLIEIQSSTNLMTWDPVMTLTVPGSGSVSFQDPNPPVANTGRFYRVLSL
jgi:hypothetical protein